MNIDKVREERQLLGVDRWFNHQCKGILFWATGVGKTYGATLAIKRIEKQKQPMYLIAVPSFELKKQWEERLSKVFPKKVTDRIIVETIQTLLFRNIKYIVDVYIVDEIHEFTSEERIRLLNGNLVEYKAILGLTASADDKNFKTISNLLPIVDVISDEEAREKGFIAEFIEYNLALSLSGEELESYEHYSRIIAENLPKFQNDLTLAQFCISGGLDKKSGKYYAAPNSPSRKARVEKEDLIKNLDAIKLNKYFTLQSRAAAIGKFIHETGSVSRAKVMLNKVIAEPNKISGAGRDTVVYRYTPSVEVAEVNGMFLSLMSEHRNLNAQLNSIKADAIEEANKQNIANEQEYQKARTAYSKEYNDWLDKIEDLQSRFNQYIITEKEKISKLKINVPDSLMETYKSIKALLTE